jgi:tRNA pseudouridine32 synthase/23S rRNA pseudouridine746 synthase
MTQMNADESRMLKPRGEARKNRGQAFGPSASSASSADKKSLSEAEIDFVRSLIIYEDGEIIALHKPPGLSSQGGRVAARTLDDLLAAFAKPSGVRPRLVHRLDRDTSGVILTARSQPGAAFLGKAMMGRRVRKTYLALVAPGAPDPREGAIEAALRKESQGREAYIKVCPADHPDAQAASTRYRTLAANDTAALVELAPRTGRMHQLRVHMASVGRPIAGDPRYGGALVLAGAPVQRLMLHAAALVFPHPSGGERRIEAPIPPDMAGLARTLGLAVPARWTGAIS